jgi:hypothetical protein
MPLLRICRNCLRTLDEKDLSLCSRCNHTSDAMAMSESPSRLGCRPLSRWELLPTRAPVEATARQPVVAGQVWRWDYPGVHFDGTEWVVLGPAWAPCFWRMSIIGDDSRVGIMVPNERVGHWTFVRDRR